MPEPLDKLLNKGLDQKFQLELPPIDQSSDASMDAPAPPEEQISVDQLKADEKFRQSADLLHILYEGEKFDGPEDALAEYGMDIMAEFNINFAGPGGVFESNPGMLSQAAQLVASGSKEHAQAFLYMNKRYAQLPNFVPSVMGRTFMAMLRDPTMFTGFGTLGAGLVARKLGKEGVQYGIKKALTAMTRIPMNAPARTGGAMVGTMTGGANIARQDIERTAEVPARMEQGLGESLTETAIDTAIGSVAGMAMIKGIEKAAPVVVEGAKNLYKGVMGKDGADEKAVINEVVELLAPEQQAPAQQPGRTEMSRIVGRVYHSGSAGEGETGRWVSSNRDYAAGYRSDLPLFYIDLKRTDPRLQGAYPEQSVDKGFTFNFELKPDEAVNLKRTSRDIAGKAQQGTPIGPRGPAVKLTPAENKFFASFMENEANREELMEAVPSLRIDNGTISVDQKGVDELFRWIDETVVLDGAGTVPPRLKKAKFYNMLDGESN
jgi:hypothetical protein